MNHQLMSPVARWAAGSPRGVTIEDSGDNFTNGTTGPLFDRSRYEGHFFGLSYWSNRIELSEEFIEGVEAVSRVRLDVNGEELTPQAVSVVESSRGGQRITREIRTSGEIERNSLLELRDRESGQVIYWGRLEFENDTKNGAIEIPLAMPGIERFDGSEEPK